MSSGMQREDATAREQAIAAVLKRAALAKTARLIKQRLALAAYKAQNGLSAVAFDQIEPRAEEQLRKRKARQLQDPEQPDPKRQALSKPTESLHTPSLDASHPFPPSMSLYDAMMTPNLNSVYGSFSPRLNEPFAESTGVVTHPSPPRLKNIIQTDPVTGLQHPSSPVSSARDETPFNRPDSPVGKTRHGRTGSLPAGLIAPSNAPGLVQAANALASLTRGPSEEPVLARASDRITPPPGASQAEKKSPRSTSAPAFGSRSSKSKTGAEGGDHETAAELMLYLASSPSPQQKKSMDVLTGHDEPMKGRKLFAEDSDALSRASQPFATTPLAPAPARPSKVQPLQPQKMPQIPVPIPASQTAPRASIFHPQQLIHQHPQLSHQQPPFSNGLPPFSTAESYTGQMHATPLFYSHPANLQPSFSMAPLPPASFPMSYSMPASAPPDLKPDPSSMYFAQSVPPPGLGVPQPRNTPPPFDVSLYMTGQPGPTSYSAIPQYQQPFGQPQAW